MAASEVSHCDLHCQERHAKAQVQVQLAKALDKSHTRENNAGPRKPSPRDRLSPLSTPRLSTPRGHHSRSHSRSLSRDLSLMSVGAASVSDNVMITI